jgi:hypothetical protein
MKQLAAFASANWRSAIAGAIGALVVMVVWAACATLIRWSAALGWIESHPGLAAWMQAILSVVAIGASSFFALWVPLHLRDLGERDAVQRAINTLLMLVNTTHSAWDSARHILRNNEWSKRSGALIRDSIERSYAMADFIPASMQLGEALTAIARCRSRLVVLSELVSHLEKADDVREAAQQMPFHDVLGELEETLEACGEMKPLKVAGSWMMFAPGDMADHPEIEAAAQRTKF